MTLDGFFEGSNHEISWHNVDEEFNRFAVEQLDNTSVIMFGRATYELMANYWPTEHAKKDDPVVAEKMNSIQKIVFSKTLEKVEWDNTRLVKEIIPEEIKRLKQQAEKDIAIFGSADLASNFIQSGLIDEFRVMVNPVVLGRGTTLFKNIDNKLNLKLIRTKTFHSGNILLYYERAKD